MLKQYYHVDEEGHILESYVFDDSDVPPMHFEGWGEGIEKPRWDFEKGKWVETRPVDEKLAELKAQKLKEMGVACEQSILGYFKYTVNGKEYDFSFDSEAQSNFTGIMTLFTKGLITQIGWTAWRNGKAERITLDEETFTQIALLGYQQIEKLRGEIQARIDECTTIEEVLKIVWEDTEDASTVDPPSTSEPTPIDPSGEPV